MSTVHCDTCNEPVNVGDLGQYDEKTGVYACEKCVAAESPIASGASNE